MKNETRKVMFILRIDKRGKRNRSYIIKPQKSLDFNNMKKQGAFISVFCSFFDRIKLNKSVM